MKSLTLFVASGLIAAVAGRVHAVELVKNGGFEAGPQFEATNWIKPDLGTDPASGEPNNYARVGNWVNQAGTDPNGYAYAPHGAGNGTGTQIPGRTTWLGGLNPRTSIIQQPINTAGYGSASLTFKVVYEDEDIGGRDFFTVDFGGARILTIDMGLGWVNWVNQFGVVRQGGIHFWRLENPVIALAPYMDGTTKNLTFTTINDATPSTSSSAWIDNVSISAVVPEPVSAGALGTLLIFARRQRG